MIKRNTKYLLSLILIFLTLCSKAQINEIKYKIGDMLTKICSEYAAVGKIKVKKIMINEKAERIIIDVTDALSYIPFRSQTVSQIYDSIIPLFDKKQQEYDFKIISNGISIDDLIPNFYRKKNFDNNRKFEIHAKKQLVKNISKPFTITKGLDKRHIALWQSHGWYYNQKLARWEWQRSRIFQTVEDLFTQSFVLPYLTPMLENAGANVIIPRERDTQTNEVIVDNDRSSFKSKYEEINNQKNWTTANDTGFANPKTFYINQENPFKMGTFRQIKSVTDTADESIAKWIPNIPESGKYAVYVSYKTVENSSSQALYTIKHKGGETKFIVDQTMGGGTWIYLGTFSFDRGLNPDYCVQLSNISNHKGKYITADAVKFGGGMGNIARRPNLNRFENKNAKRSGTKGKEKNNLPTVAYDYETSGYPRFCEAARYWMQWAGIDSAIYNRSEGKNDYTDDYKSRGEWVNYIAGGSVILPKNKGLGIPIDLAFAFHSDAGTVLSDSIIGTLGIFMTKTNKEKFENDVSRYASRDLTDIIMTNIVDDIRKTFNDSTWTRRGMWNKSYSEARVPETPTMLIELLSHQNFADMRYGLDPRFKFVVSRAIYKGMLKFIASQNNFKYVVQPLPVEQFSAEFKSNTEVELKWKSVTDSIEPTAKPNKYIVYTRINDGDFDNGRVVENQSCIIDIETDKIYSFKITAANDGGESFPSEILSVCRLGKEKGTVLIVNGFDRISAPESFNIDNKIAGFVDKFDYGVPYKYDISYTGSQYEYNCETPWTNDDAPGFGASHATYETKIIAGNSFDYPSIHGKAIANSGFSFVSCSAKAVENKQINMLDYNTVDLILGKQRQTKTGSGKGPSLFKTFSDKMKNEIETFSKKGGNMFVSGAFIASDLCNADSVSAHDKYFAKNILHYIWRTGMASTNGKVKGVKSYMMEPSDMEFNTTLNDSIYIVESPDGIVPADERGSTILRYSENNISAGIAYKNNIFKCVITGFPFETIITYGERNEFMKKIIDFFTRKQ